jgi:peptidoglycan hydrolase-like protein with peptidoglycan-binding domain
MDHIRLSDASTPQLDFMSNGTTGYQVGPADGALGAKTIAALKSFQATHGLPVSGALDQATVAALKSEMSKK